MYEGGGKICREDTQGIVFLETDWDGSNLPMDLVEGAGISGSQFETIDPWEREKLGGYAKIGSKVVFLLEPDRFPFLFKRDNCEVFLASEWNGWEQARKGRLLEVGVGRRKSCLWMNWEDLTHLGSFAFKFITGDGIGSPPLDSFLGVEEKSPGAINFVFDQSRTGKDLVSFQILKSPESQNLDILKRARPLGEFDTGNARTVAGSGPTLHGPSAFDLIIIADETENAETIHPMIFQEDGSWTVEFPEKATGKLYRLAVTHHEHENPQRKLDGRVSGSICLGNSRKGGPGIAIHPPPPVDKDKTFSPR